MKDSQSLLEEGFFATLYLTGGVTADFYVPVLILDQISAAVVFIPETKCLPDKDFLGQI